jgi:assimilatory nitrate reductase electron transfer subunit
VADLTAGTRATTGCGSCRESVAGILGWLHTIEGAAAEEVRA